MMVAIAVKTMEKGSKIAPLFGKARYFSFVANDGTIDTKANEASGGVGVVNWLESLGVESVIVNHLGQNPFNALSKKGIRVMHAGEEALDASTLWMRYIKGELTEVNAQNYTELLGGEHHHEEGDAHHGNCGKGHHHGEGHEHGEECHHEHGECDHEWSEHKKEGKCGKAKRCCDKP